MMSGTPPFTDGSYPLEEWLGTLSPPVYSHLSVITTYQEHTTIDALECQLIAPVHSFRGVPGDDSHSVHKIDDDVALPAPDVSVIVSLHILGGGAPQHTDSAQYTH